MTGNLRSKPAVILSGGGANGAFEIGVLKALAEGASPATKGAPLEPEIFSGTSVGAYNAAVLTSNSDGSARQAVAALEDVWLTQIVKSAKQCGNGVYRFRGDPAPFLETECLAANPLLPLLSFARDTAYLTGDALLRTKDFLSSAGSLQTRLLEQFNLADFVDVQRFYQTIHETVDLPAIRDSSQTLFVTASNWNIGTARVFSNADLTDEIGHKAIQASAAIPGIFPHVKIGDAVYVDGGLLANTPLSSPIRAGATELHVVFLDPLIGDINLPRLPNSLDTGYRSLAILWANTVRQDIQIAGSINLTIDMLDRARAGEEISDEDLVIYARTADRIRRRQEAGTPLRRSIPVHSYRPPQELGSLVEALDFGRARVERLMQMGYEAAVNHDCDQEGCSIPDWRAENRHQVAVAPPQSSFGRVAQTSP